MKLVLTLAEKYPGVEEESVAQMLKVDLKEISERFDSLAYGATAACAPVVAPYYIVSLI